MDKVIAGFSDGSSVRGTPDGHSAAVMQFYEMGSALRCCTWCCRTPSGAIKSGKAPYPPYLCLDHPSELFERNRRPDQRRLQRSRRADGDDNRVAERVSNRVGVNLPIVCQPDVSRRIDLTTRYPFQSIASVTGCLVISVLRHACQAGTSWYRRRRSG